MDRSLTLTVTLMSLRLVKLSKWFGMERRTSSCGFDSHLSAKTRRLARGAFRARSFVVFYGVRYLDAC